MIKLTIQKGFFIIIDENNQMYPGWVGDNPPDYPELPDVDTVYQKCMNKGYSKECTIDILLYIFHRQRLIRSGFLTEIPLVIGLVGGAGAGKSVGGAAIAIYDYLLAGVPLISNMDVEVTVRYKEASKVFRSESMDRVALLDIKTLGRIYRNACLFVDEANIEFSEARRAMSNKNLASAYVLQERRKRMLSIIHTEQNEMWGDDRLRFATDLFIKVKDSAYDNGLPQPGTLGRRSHWKVFDTSGVINGEIVGEKDPRFVVYEGDFHNTPFWYSFDTYQLQGGEEETDKQSDIRIKDGIDISGLKEKYRLGRQIAAQCVERGIGEIVSDDLWDMLGITGNRSEITKLGQDFKGMGIPTTRRGRHKIYYNFGGSKFSDDGSKPCQT